MVYKKGKGLDLGAEPPRIKIWLVPFPPGFDLMAMQFFPSFEAVNCWVVLNYFFKSSQFGAAWTISNENLTLKSDVQVYSQVRNTISLNK